MGRSDASLKGRMMKFSFFVMPVHHPSENPALAFQRDISLIHLADELDFDEFLIGEHHSGGWETMPLPEMALLIAAAKALRTQVGFLIRPVVRSLDRYLQFKNFSDRL